MFKAALFVLTLHVTGCGAVYAGPPLYEVERSRTTAAGMIVLGSWALANAAVSGPLWFATDGSTRRFHEMNVVWNVVNLGIAGFGLLAENRSVTLTGIEDAVAAQRRLESLLYLNIGLDAAYMAAGWALLERGLRGGPDGEIWTGYGTSLILQGGFLFAFDIVFLLFQQRNRPIVSGPER